MKKLLSIMFAVSMLLVSFSACTNIPEKETPTQPESITDVQGQTDAEASSSDSQYETLIIENEKYRFTVQKTDYEKRYSEEVLNEISELFPIEFGCDDYNNWDENPNTVLNDIYYSMGRWAIDTYDNESAEHKAAVEELNNSPYGNPNLEGFFTSVEKINSFLRDIYGPSARTFKTKDFDTYDEIRMREENIFSDYEYSFRFAYLPNSKIICCFARETWGGEMPTMGIRDIKMSNGEYVVEFVSDCYYSCYIKYLITVSAEKNGNLYVKNVEDFYVFPNNANNLKVISDNVEVEFKKYNSGDWITVGTLSAGDKVYSASDIDFADRYVWIVTEKYQGRVEKQCLVPIE